jgi:hypothetical protein
MARSSYESVGGTLTASADKYQYPVRAVMENNPRNKFRGRWLRRRLVFVRSRRGMGGDPQVVDLRLLLLRAPSYGRGDCSTSFSDCSMRIWPVFSPRDVRET